MKTFTPEQLKQETNPEAIYRHSDGGFYTIVGFHKHKSSNGEWVESVQYHKYSTKNDVERELFSRTLASFCDRFMLVEEENIIRFFTRNFNKLSYSDGAIATIDPKVILNGTERATDLVENNILSGDMPSIVLFTVDPVLMEWKSAHHDGMRGQWEIKTTVEMSMALGGLLECARFNTFNIVI